MTPAREITATMIRFCLLENRLYASSVGAAALVRAGISGVFSDIEKEQQQGKDHWALPGTNEKQEKIDQIILRALGITCSSGLDKASVIVYDKSRDCPHGTALPTKSTSCVVMLSPW